ncbi:MAG: phosphotransferase family protein [Sphingomonadales bacterium]|nr:phosphotransferase family protein [Sphingomonadales bacterium]MBU3990952.1 phosphotransferase family protein [Alphaproteobacteria bacterium]
MTTEAAATSLAAWIARTPAFRPRTEIVSFVQFAGGQSSELFRLVCHSPDGGEERFIVRLEQRGKQLFMQPDILREFRVMDGVARAGTVPVPPMIAVESDPSVLGQRFLVMREVAGQSPLGRPSLHRAGLLTELAPEERRRIAENGIDAMAAIHGIDWRKSHAFLAEGNAGRTALEAHLARLEEWYAWATQGRPFPITDRALEYLRANRSGLQDTEEVLLWGDARPGNILFAADQSVAAVLDWEGALIGPRGLDVAYWVMSDEFHAEAIGIPRSPGWPGAEDVLARYRTASGKDVPDLEYFVIMGAFFMATTLIRATDISVEAGRLSPGSTMATANTLTQILADRLGLPVPPLSPDFVAHRSLPPGTLGLAS